MVTYLYAPMDKLKKSLAPILIAAGVSGILASMGDFMVTSILGSLYPGYSFIHRPESYLGTSDSPVALYMNTWGLVFCFLLIFFAWGLRKKFSNMVDGKHSSLRLLCCMVLARALAQDCFPIIM